MSLPNEFGAEVSPLGNTSVVISKAAQNAVTGYAIQRLSEQPWYKKSSNTVSTVVSGSAVLAWWLTSTGVGLPMWLTYLVGALAVVGQGIVTKQTKNGFTTRGAAELQHAVQDEGVLMDLWDTVTKQAFPMHTGHK